MSGADPAQSSFSFTILSALTEPELGLLSTFPYPNTACPPLRGVLGQDVVLPDEALNGETTIETVAGGKVLVA